LNSHNAGVNALFIGFDWGGLAWALAGGASANYILEETSPNQQPLYLAWYNIALQSGVLVGALLAPLLANWLSIVAALIVAAIGRLLSGSALWRLSSKAVQSPALTAQPPGNI
jgi:MFS family permease